jgi:hypothetical protein
MSLARNIANTLILIFLVLILVRFSHAHPQFEGIWVDENGHKIQILQSEDELAGYSISDKIEVFRATIKYDPDRAVRRVTLTGLVFGKMKHGTVADECPDWTRAWLRGHWEVKIDGLIEGEIQPLRVTSDSSLFSQTCGVEVLPKKVSSSFTRSSPTDSNCVTSSQYPAWLETIKPYVEELYAHARHCQVVDHPSYPMT